MYLGWTVDIVKCIVIKSFVVKLEQRLIRANAAQPKLHITGAIIHNPGSMVGVDWEGEAGKQKKGADMMRG